MTVEHPAGCAFYVNLECIERGVATLEFCNKTFCLGAFYKLVVMLCMMEFLYIIVRIV